MRHARSHIARSLGVPGPFGLGALVALLLAGCGIGPGQAPSGIRLSVTDGFGARAVGLSGAPRVGGQETVMGLLMRNYQVKTRFGGGFVESIEGHSGGTQAGEPSDWFYYVNGVEAPKGAADTNLQAGDRIWWDLHDWSQTQEIPAVVGSYPEPFLDGIEGRRYPVRVECAEPSSSACATVHDRLSALGVPAAGAAVSDEEDQLTLRVLVGPYSALGDSLSVHDVGAGPRYSGVYARFSGSGSALTLLDPAGKPVRTLGAGAGLIAATRYGKEAPVWLITGTDAAGANLAASSLSESALRNCFALALEPSGTAQPVPVGP
ncbi:MAG TPA: DUF4430 domain-containing protein [Solirubrobacteraceae bacterium]